MLSVVVSRLALPNSILQKDILDESFSAEVFTKFCYQKYLNPFDFSCTKKLQQKTAPGGWRSGRIVRRVRKQTGMSGWLGYFLVCHEPS